MSGPAVELGGDAVELGLVVDGAVLLSALAPAAHAGLTERVSVSSAGAQAQEGWSR